MSLIKMKKRSGEGEEIEVREMKKRGKLREEM